MQFTLQRHSGIGISLEEDRIELVRVGQSRANIDVTTHAVVPFLKDVYQSGWVYNVERFAAELKNIFDKFNLPKNGVTICLPSSIVALRKLTMPKVNRKQMKKVLQFQIQHEIRLPFADPVYDFDYYPSSLDADGSILLVATPRGVIDGVLAAFKQAGVELTAIEVKGLSILRVLKTLNKREQTDMIVTEIGTQRVDAHFYKKGSLLLTRSLDIQADNYTHLPNHPALEEVAAAIAEGATGPATQGMDIFYNDLQTHLQRSISFVQYSLKERDLTIETIYITGGVPHSEYFADILHKRMGSNVTPLNLPAVNQFGGDPLEYVSLSAAGAALRGRIPDAN